MRKKIVIAVMVAACLITIVYSAVLIIRVKPEEWLDYMPNQEYEQGGIFVGETDGQMPGMKFAAKNGNLSLYINEVSTTIAVYDNTRGTSWFSNPVDINDDSIANPAEKALLSSQFSITYFDAKVNLLTKENFSESIERKQFELESIKDGVRIIYTLGDFSKNIDFLPLYIKTERLNELILSKLNTSDKNYVKTRYFESEEKPGFSQRALTVERSAFITQKMISLFEQAGYTYEQRDEDDSLAGYKTQETRPFFKIPLEYRLVDGQLKASIPVSKIEKSEGFQITSIRLLNFFGCAGTDDTGYIFVPNGAGSLINFNNGKKTAPAYVQPVYDFDPMMERRIGSEINESVRMPIFGIKKNDDAFLAIIEEGSAFSSVNADVSGKFNSFNTAGVVFNIKTSEKLSMMGVTGDQSDLPMVEAGDYNGRITVSYRFLHGDEANYSGMAKSYRETLVKEYNMEPVQEQKDMPFFLDLVGTIEKSDRVLGIPYQKTISLTTVEQASDIIKQLQTKGINNIKLRYTGWFNGGINHYSAKSFDISKKNGSLKELRELDSLLSETGGSLYLDTAFLKIYKSSDSHGYQKRKESSRYISGAEALLSPINPATLRMSAKPEDGAYYILSPAYLASYISSFLKSFGKSGLSGVSLQDLGNLLPSDKDKNGAVNREQSKIIIAHELEKLRHDIGNIMLDGGNIYAVPYTDIIVDAPMHSDQYLIVDEDIPFYQMVLHGYREYAGKAQNEYSSDNTDDSLLKMIEYGCGLRYFWSHSDDSMLKDSGLRYSSVNYMNSLDESTEKYRKISDALNGLNGETIDSHEIVKKGVRKLVYQNGTTVYVNYNSEKETADGYEIGAKSFYVSKEQI